MAEALIIDACRTPRGIGKAGKGALSDIHPQQLGAAVLRALKERTGIDTADVDDIIWGTSAQVGPQSGDIGRMSALDAGYDVRASGVTLDRFCGSGITSVNMAAASIMAGAEDLVIAGGTEKMSMTARRGDGPLMMDSGNLRLRAKHPQSHQGVCADAVATLEGIGREDTDRLALLSQQRAATAIANGYFSKSVVPVSHEDGRLALDKEEYPRPQTTLEGLAALKPAFPAIADFPLDESGTTYRKLILEKYPDLEINHIHHAGNSSGVVDGSAAILLASPSYAKKHGLKPRAKVVAMANMGDSPTLMLNAPVPAARKVLAKAGLDIDDIDLFEINEAFAVVAEKFIRDLKLDRDKVNVNGGAIALGHPIGATGSMLIGTLLDELERRDLRRGLVTMCAAGGMAPAIIIERSLASAARDTLAGRACCGRAASIAARAQSFHEAAANERRIARLPAHAWLIVDLCREQHRPACLETAVDEGIEVRLVADPFAVGEAGAARQCDDVGQPAGRRRLLAGDLIDAVVPDDDGQIGRSGIGDGGQRAEHHQDRAVALERDHAAFGLRQRHAERDRARQTHAAEHVEILRAVTGGNQVEIGVADAGDHGLLVLEPLHQALSERRAVQRRYCSLILAHAARPRVT